MIWTGGMLARWDQKIGFADRALWPVKLGKALFEFSQR
jgi:hypothetical protein